MPPRRAKRAKTSDTKPATGVSIQAPPSNYSPKGKANEIVHDINNGKCKFVEVPTEVLLEIMSYFPAVHIPTSRRHNTPVLPPFVFERWDVLRALSQTCQLWRSIFLPMLWERMEACAIRTELDQPRYHTLEPVVAPQEIDMSDFRGEQIPVNWYKGVSSLLEKLSNGLIENPDVAKHVRVVNVSLTRCSTGTVLPAFVKCLENLPNLHTLQILRAHTAMTGILKTHFDGHRFPNVRSIIVPEHGHEILRCCPEVRKVICNAGNGSKVVTAIAKCCRKVEVLEGIGADENVVKRLVKACPNLKELKLEGAIERNHKVFAHLASLKNLVKLELGVNMGRPDTYLQDAEITRAIKSAQDILKASKNTEKKTLKISSDCTGWRFNRFWTVDIPVDVPLP